MIPPNAEQIAWVVSKLWEHANSEDTFRCLLARLEDRIDYTSLQVAGGLWLHNALVDWHNCCGKEDQIIADSSTSIQSQ